MNLMYYNIVHNIHFKDSKSLKIVILMLVFDFCNVFVYYVFLIGVTGLLIQFFFNFNRTFFQL